jgi:hypothetical protein
MKRFVVGFGLGYFLGPVIREYTFVKEHPDHPRAEEFQTHVDKIKRDWENLKTEIKRSWRNAEQTINDRQTFDEMTKDWDR